MKIVVTVVLAKLVASATLALTALASAPVAHASLVVAGQSRWNATFSDSAVLDVSQVHVQSAYVQQLAHQLDGSRVDSALGGWSMYCSDAAFTNCWSEFDYYDA